MIDDNRSAFVRYSQLAPTSGISVEYSEKTDTVEIARDSHLRVALERPFRVDHDLAVGVDGNATAGERKRDRVPSAPRLPFPVADEGVQRVGIDAGRERLEVVRIGLEDRRDGHHETRTHRLVIRVGTPRVIRSAPLVVVERATDRMRDRRQPISS